MQAHKIKYDSAKYQIILRLFSSSNCDFLCPRCMGIYTDTLNIFIRVATMLAGGGGGRKK